MHLEKLHGLELPAAADMHVHLRDGSMMEVVVPTIRKGGVDTVYVMPNLVPPITTVKHALEYQRRIKAIEPNVNFLMSLYLHSDITPEVIKEAKQAGIIGVKSYPAGVTTNSAQGVVDYASFYPTFAEMEKQDLVLNLHGELPSSKERPDITVLNAEEEFIPTLLKLHADFPRLRIILEHCTSAKAIQAVKQCGPTVAATICPHHMIITIDNAVGNPYHFCKPVAKLPSDRKALLEAVVSSNPKFFFGTDSAPHTIQAKEMKHAAGVFTQPNAVGLVFDALELACEKGILKEEDITAEILKNFLSEFGRSFYKAPETKERIVLGKGGNTKIADVVTSADNEVQIAPFRRGEKTWSITWKV